MKNFLHPPRYTRKPLHPSKNTPPQTSNKEKIIRWIMLGIFMIISYFAGWMQLWAKQITNSIAYLASKSIGQSMQSDRHNRINILLVGYGGGTHDGAQLADSIIVASYDPKAHRVSMLSLPRDLIVLNKEGKTSKLNAILSRSYNTNGRDIASAAQDLITTVEKITGLTIPYYAMIDFNGFVELVDGLGGIDIYVPQHFLDREYPVDWNGSYEIFELFEGRNHLSGPNTLKYARSRHSTSDFSRSRRQQKIIEAIAKKILSDGISASKIGDLYASYTNIIKTNISLEELIGLAQHGTNLPAIITAGYTSQCNNNAWRTMTMGCFLREAKGGLLPAHAPAGEIEAYHYTQHFAQIIHNNPAFIQENLPITIYNASDKEQIKTLPFGEGIGSKTASKLKKYGLNIVRVTNSDLVSTGSFVQIYGTGSYEATLEILKTFVPIDRVEHYPDMLDPQGVLIDSGAYLYLGDNYIQHIGTQEFDYYSPWTQSGHTTLPAL